LTAGTSSAFTALVVYDFDEDDTIPVVKQLRSRGERRVWLVKNTVGRGVVGAIRTGFEQVSHRPVLVVMADLSDDLHQIDEMLGRSVSFPVGLSQRQQPPSLLPALGRPTTWFTAAWSIQAARCSQPRLATPTPAPPCTDGPWSSIAAPSPSRT
jgi:hypothetical protein